jgi:hypothetical protein
MMEGVGETLQEFSIAIKQLANSALPENHIREAGKALANGVEYPTIKMRLLLGQEKTVNKALRQALELQAVLLAARPPKTSARAFCGSQSPPHRAKRHKTISMLEL